MPSSQIQPFATGGGANVRTPSDWLDSPTRLQGFQSGTASSTDTNTPIRQASYVAAMVAQFIVDRAAVDVLDNGNVSTLEANFITALQNTIGTAFNNSLWHYGVDSGSTNAVVADVSPNVSWPLSGGTAFVVKAANNNSGASTFLPDGVSGGAKPIVRTDGSAVQAGDIKANALIVLIYDAGADKYQLMPALQAQTPSEPALVHSGTDVNGSANTITATVTPAITSYALGSVYFIKLANTVTGATTANLNSLGSKNVVRSSGAPLQAGDILAGQMIPLMYDGTNLQVIGLNPLLIPGNTYQDLSTPGSSSQTYPAGSYFVEVWAAGGGGGGCAGANGSGSGGGGGEFRSGVVTFNVSTSVTVTVGAGGAAGSTSPTDGSNGGASSFGSFITAVGGSGGRAGNGGIQNSIVGAGGSGGSGGFIANSGQGGGFGFMIGSAPVSGQGGPSGNGGSYTLLNITTASGATPGSFPGGGASGASGSGGLAAAGAGGRIIVRSL